MEKELHTDTSLTQVNRPDTQNRMQGKTHFWIPRIFYCSNIYLFSSDSFIGLDVTIHPILFNKLIW